MWNNDVHDVTTPTCQGAHLRIFIHTRKVFDAFIKNQHQERRGYLKLNQVGNSRSFF